MIARQTKASEHKVVTLLNISLKLNCAYSDFVLNYQFRTIKQQVIPTESDK